MESSSQVVRAGGRGGSRGGGSRFRQSGSTTSKKADTTADATADESTVCPECNGQARWEQREAICSDCGLVLDEDMVDRGPEWRAFNQHQTEKRRRVGSPITETLHDRGLSTNIGQTKEAESLQMKRMRELNNQTNKTSHRSKRHSFAKIRGVVSSLDLPQVVHERACQLFRRGQSDHDLTVGRSLEALYGAAVYAACREHDVPYRMDEIAGETSGTAKEVRQTYYRLKSEMGLKISPQSPSNFIPRLVSEINYDQEIASHISDFVQYRATQLVKFAEAENASQGRDPLGVAGAAIYYIAHRNGSKINQEEATIGCLSTHALRESRDAIVTALEEAGETVSSICAENWSSDTDTDTAEADAADDVVENTSTTVDEPDQSAITRPTSTLLRAERVLNANAGDGRQPDQSDNGSPAVDARQPDQSDNGSPVVDARQPVMSGEDSGATDVSQSIRVDAAPTTADGKPSPTRGAIPPPWKVLRA